MNTVTIELCAEDRARIDKLISLAEQNLTAALHVAPQAPEPTTTPEPEASKVEAPTPEPTPEPKITEPEAPKAEVTEEPKKIGFAPTIDNLRKIALMLTSSGHKEAVRNIVNKYAPKLSDVPEDKIAECMAELEKVG